MAKKSGSTAMAVIELPDEGMATVSVRGQDFTVDIYEVYSKLSAIINSTEGDKERMAAFQEILSSYGVPSLPHAMLTRFANSIYAAFIDLKKKVDAVLPSPLSTADSTPSP